MIELHTLGDAVIKIGTKEVRPTSPMVFAALLYLCVERGRRVPRAALQELLFPDVDERSGAHSLRQLLYKLRQLGVPLDSDAVSVRIATAPSIDFETLCGAELLQSAAAGRLDFLPGFGERISSAFEEWLDGCRSTAVARIRETLVGALSDPSLRVDYSRTRRICESILSIDAFNEQATLRLAEALALSGQRHDAMQLLDAYEAELGAPNRPARFPAALRQRIFESPDAQPQRIPLVGRDADLSWLFAQFRRATEDHTTVTVLWGDAGIGKTRLTEEFVSHLRLQKATVQTVQCQPRDSNRPLGVFLDLVPHLLPMPGALGVSPTSMQYLNAITGAADRPADTRDEVLAFRITSAVTDLVTAVASEQPLVLVVEDCHWADESSIRLLFQIIPAQTSSVHVLLTSRNKPPPPETLSSHVFARRLEPLSADDAMRLLTHCVRPGASAVSELVKKHCVAIASGNPLFVKTIAEHLHVSGSLPNMEARISDLLRQRMQLLEPASLLLLRCVAALGRHCTDLRLSKCASFEPGTELLAIQQCAALGLIKRDIHGMHCSHELISETVLADCPEVVSAAMYRRVATLLEEEGSSDRDATLLWSCAEAWRIAGEKSRAAAVWQRCANFALQIGQPKFAVAALEECQRMIEEEKLPGVIERSIAAAELAFDFTAVLRNVERFKAIRSSAGTATNRSVELAEINALRRSGKSVWHLRDRLRSCALDASASPSNRIKAARIFFTAAELHNGAPDARELYAALDASALSVDAKHWCDMNMIYNGAFGDISLGGEYAVELLGLLTYDDPSESSMCGNAAMFLYRAGDMERSIRTLHDAISLNTRFDLSHMLSQCVSQLTTCYIALGEWDKALDYHKRGEKLLAQAGHAGDHVANSLDFAIRARDYTAARRILAILKSYDEAASPILNRIVIGYELIIAAGDGALQASRLNFGMLEQLDAELRQSSEHQIFAIGLALATCAANQREVARDRWSSYIRDCRRERFPLKHYCYAVAHDKRFLQIVDETLA